MLWKVMKDNYDKKENTFPYVEKSIKRKRNRREEEEEEKE